MLDCNLDYLSGDSMTGHIVLVVHVDAIGLLTLRATATYLFADPTPADNTAVVLANEPVPVLPAPVVQPAPVAVVRPVIGPATITPAAAAGRHVAVSFKITRSDNHKPLTRGTMICDPSIQGKVIQHAEQFTNGVARLAFTIPKNAKGKLLKVRLTIKLAGRSAATVATFVVK